MNTEWMNLNTSKATNDTWGTVVHIAVLGGISLVIEDCDHVHKHWTNANTIQSDKHGDAVQLENEIESLEVLVEYMYVYAFKPCREVAGSFWTWRPLLR